MYMVIGRVFFFFFFPPDCCFIQKAKQIMDHSALRYLDEAVFKLDMQMVKSLPGVDSLMDTAWCPAQSGTRCVKSGPAGHTGSHLQTGNRDVMSGDSHSSLSPPTPEEVVQTDVSGSQAEWDDDDNLSVASSNLTVEWLHKKP